MKHPHTRVITMLTCLLLLFAVLLTAAKGPPSGLTAIADAVPATAESLDEAERELENRRLELSDLLLAYEKGQVKEQKTARLIAEVEKLRLHVEALRAKIAQNNDNL